MNKANKAKLRAWRESEKEKARQTLLAHNPNADKEWESKINFLYVIHQEIEPKKQAIIAAESGGQVNKYRASARERE